MSRRAWWAFAVMSVTWGASYLLIKIGIDGGVPAPDVAWLRVALAAIILVAFAWRAGTLPTLSGRWRWVLGYAVAEISIGKSNRKVGCCRVGSTWSETRSSTNWGHVRSSAAP